MRVVIAMMKHETNTFSPVVTDWPRFQSWSGHLGDAALAAYDGTAMPFGAYLELARAAGAEIVTPLAAEAMPSGKVTRDAYDLMSDAILDAVRDGCDLVLLDLHGAMVAEHDHDGEGRLLEAIRQIAPDVPIGVTYDLHTNLSDRMVDNCTALIGYKTYPHTDMYEVGKQIGQVMFDYMAGKCSPVTAWGQLPLMSQTLMQGTADEPMKTLIAMARQAEQRPGVLAVTVFGGFPMADIPITGNSVVVVTDNDMALAEQVRDEILNTAWERREEFIYQHRPLVDAVAEAKQLTDGPVILLDHADNVGSGGTSDVMTVIAEVLRQGLQDVAVAAVYDPQAVREMQAAGIGATITLSLGGKTDMPSIGEVGEPLTVTGKVKVLNDGEWVCRGPMYTGVDVFMGDSAVFRVDGVDIVVTSRHHEPWDAGVFTSMGIQPEYKKYLLLKSRIHYRAGFAHLARHTLTLDGVGVTTSDNSILTFENVRRPIYPLDRINEV